jgi:hypothetical protein
MRRSPEVLPILCLHGLLTDDFREALPVLLGKDATGLSRTAITRLTAEWGGEYEEVRWRDQDKLPTFFDFPTLVRAGVKFSNGIKEKPNNGSEGRRMIALRATTSDNAS